MLPKRIHFARLLLAAPLALGLAAPARAYDIIQTSLNNTGAVTNGQKLVLYGGQTISPTSLTLGPSTPYTTLGVQASPTATAVNYTNQAVAGAATGTISVRTGGNSALVKSLSWMNSTGGFQGNATVIGGSATASPNTTTAIPPSTSRGSGIKLAQAAPTKSLDWTFYNSSPHTALVRFFSFQFMVRTFVAPPGDVNLPPVETFTPADILTLASPVSLFGGATLVRTPPVNNITFQFSIPPGGGVVYHFFPVTPVGDFWVQANGVSSGNDPGEGPDLNTFTHRVQFPTCDNGPRPWTSGETRAAFIIYELAKNCRSSRRSDLDNLIVAEGDVLINAADFQVTNLNILVPTLDMPDLTDLFDPGFQAHGRAKQAGHDEHGGEDGGRGNNGDSTATQAKIELGTLVINISRNALCPDDSVTIGTETMTVEQWMYKAAGLINNDTSHRSDNTIALRILQFLNRPSEDH